MENETTTTVTFEHRLAVAYTHEHGATFQVGEVLERTKRANKRAWYGKNQKLNGFTYFAGQGEIPAENVAVFKITRETIVTETEEAL